MKKNVKIAILLSIFWAIYHEVCNFAMSKETEQKAREPRLQLMNGHELLKDIDTF